MLRNERILDMTPRECGEPNTGAQEEFKKAAALLPDTGCRPQLIRGKKRSFFEDALQKGRLKTPALSSTVDGKHFKNGGFGN